jgi:hypothetical protein
MMLALAPVHPLTAPAERQRVHSQQPACELLLQLQPADGARKFIGGNRIERNARGRSARWIWSNYKGREAPSVHMLS